MIESLCLYLHCQSAALLCYTGFQNQSLIQSTSCSCSTSCFGLGFQLQNLQDFIKISRALIKDIFLFQVPQRCQSCGPHQAKCELPYEESRRSTRLPEITNLSTTAVKKESVTTNGKPNPNPKRNSTTNPAPNRKPKPKPKPKTKPKGHKNDSPPGKKP